MIKRMVKAESKLSIEKLCNLLELPVSSYYYQPAVPPEQEKMNEMAKQMFDKSFNTYGKRRLSNALRKEGFAMGVFKTSRLMKTLGLVAKRPKKPHYYPVGKELPNIPNHLNREFNPPNINTHWVGDMTYIRSHQGWSYLATVMDLGNKEIVGYEISKTPDAQLAKRALINAIAKHQPDTTQLMFHSDQGVQYTANLFKDCLALHKITQSMSRRGNCWDNAVQERFFRNLKTEYLNDLSFMNHQSVVDAVEKYIGFYNHKRLNSAIDYLTPVQKRLEMQKVA